MSMAVIGALAGFVFGVSQFFVMQWVAGNMDKQHRGPGPNPSSKMVRMVGWLDIPVFTFLGYFIGPMIAGSP